MIRVTATGFICYRNDATGWSRSYKPGHDLTDAPQEVVEKAAEIWTPEVIAAYQAAVVAAEPPPLTDEQLMEMTIRKRRDEYREHVDPLTLEAVLLREAGQTAEAQALIDAAIAKRAEIKARFPKP